MSRKLLSKRYRFALVVLAFVGASPALRAQIAVEQSEFRRLGDEIVTRYRVGVKAKATKGPVQNIVAMVAVPFECDEQHVEIIEEDVTPQVAGYEYQLLREGGARRMLVTIPFLARGEEAHALVTFEVHTRAVLPPEDELTAQLVVPLKPDRELKRYLGKSPFIQTGDRSLKKVSREVFDKLAADPVEQETTDSADQSELPVEEGTPAETAEVSAAAEETGDDESAVVEIADAQLLAEPTPWQQVEAIYNYVEDNIKYVEGDDKSAVETLRDGQGDCQNISALMVGLCRTNKIPARIVWVHEHNYFEFCLADAEGNLHWFPCESSGMRAFGEMPLPRVILQKGDSFRVPEKPRETLRYASNFATAQGLPGSGKPRITYVGEKL